jgi:AcrR family transcriptional regulator
VQPNSRSGNQESRTFIETARRAQIIGAAITVLAELGYTKASFVKIAKHAGISPGLISYHFHNKEELMAQVVTEVNAEMERAIEDRADGGADASAVLRALIEGFVHYCAAHPERLVAVAQIEAAEGWGAEERESSIADFEEVLRGGQATGEFRDFPTRLMAVTLLAALEAVPTELHTRPDTSAEALAEHLATTFTLAVRQLERAGR